MTWLCCTRVLYLRKKMDHSSQNGLPKKIDWIAFNSQYSVI